MSVPTHNLYDFVHQVIEKRAIIKYFYPWGSRKLGDVIDLLPGHSDELMHKLFDPDNVCFKKSLPDQWYRYVPIIMCHDQEPLNFNFYTDEQIYSDSSIVADGEYLERFLDKAKDCDEVCVDLNLRHVFPTDWQQKWVLLHSEKNSIELDKYTKTDKFFPVYWWSHALLSLDWYRFAKYDKNLIRNSDYKKLFLCYCRDFSGSREYRSEFIQKIDDKKIKSFCQTQSFDFNNISSNSSAEYNSYDISNTAINVILETVFDERVHLTEKTLRPIACGQPFILANGPGALKYLQSYGFKTFHPLIDESYDNELNSDTRLEMITNEMCRISNLPDEKRKEIFIELDKIAEYNKKVFFSDNFENQVINELKNNLTYALSEIQYKMDWKFRWKIHKASKKNNLEKLKKNYTNRKNILLLLKHLKSGGTIENYGPPNSD